jgi:predicted dehydrogenase
LAPDATGVISVSMVERPNYQNRVEFFGTEGAMRINHRGEIFLASAGQNDWREVEVDFDKPIEGAPDTGFSRGFTSFAPKIVEAIRRGATEIEHAATFRDGYEIQKVLDAARKSDEIGAVVKL